MVMEGLRGFEHKVSYRIGGHSGDSDDLTFVEEGSPPANDRDRLQVIRKMNAHAELCDSGDNTLRCAKKAIRDIVKQEGDEYFVFLLSDANLDVYGIGSTELLSLLNLDRRVRVFIIFIGSIGDQAQTLTQALPAGQVFTALDTADVPLILRKCLLFSASGGQ